MKAETLFKIIIIVVGLFTIFYIVLALTGNIVA
jgi:hypothetical protein